MRSILLVATAVALFVFKSDASAQMQDSREQLLKVLIAARTGDSLGRNIHWAESHDSVLARFADCRPHPSGVACMLRDSIPTYSFEITLIAADTAEVTIRRYRMAYQSCPLRRPLDPPVVSAHPSWETWARTNGRWAIVRGRGVVC